MKRELREQWITALRSGKYDQGIGALCENGTHCALGVLCELATQANFCEKRFDSHGQTTWYNNQATFLPDIVLLWSGLSKDDEYQIANLNDADCSFIEISCWIEHYVKTF